MGLLRMAARTAVVAGTATAVSGRVAHRQNEKYDAQDTGRVRSAGGGRSRPRRPRNPTRTRSSRTWRSLHAQGVLTDEEFAAAKAKALGHLGAFRPVACVRSSAYTRLAGVYDEVVVDPCHGAWAAFLDELFRADEDGVRDVLDVCCGTGLLAAELVARGYRVTGVDASEAMLARARRLLGPETRLIRATLPDLPVEEAFDAAVCTLDGFTYLAPPDLRRTVARAGSTAAPGRLARVRRPHGRDDGLHERPPRRGRREGGPSLRDPQRRRPGRARLRHPHRAHPGGRGSLQRGAPPLLPPRGGDPGGARATAAST